MLRARDFDHVPSDLGTQKRRLRRQRFMETALPCAIIAALVVAAVFTVGHVGANARASIEHTRLLKAQMMPDPRMQLTTQRPEVSVLRADTPLMAFKPLSDDEASFVGNDLQR